MRFLFLWLFIFIFSGLGIHWVHPHADHSDSSEEHTIFYKAADAPWQADLESFGKLLKTDADAAMAELQRVAPKLFGEHLLMLEWVPLYFRVRKDGTTHPSDLKRISELEIRMLESIDPKKYAKQIQYHQQSIKRASAFRQRRTDPAPTGEIKGKWSSPTLDIYRSEGGLEDPMWVFDNFNQLLPTDPKAARAELNKYATLRYENHPLKAKWTELVFRHCRDKKAKLLDSMRVYELEKQMLTDIDAEKHAEGIKNLDQLLKYHKRLQKTFERQGEPNPTLGVEYKMNLKTAD